jgi:hypothetical protein
LVRSLLRDRAGLGERVAEAALDLDRVADLVFDKDLDLEMVLEFRLRLLGGGDRLLESDGDLLLLLGRGEGEGELAMDGDRRRLFPRSGLLALPRAPRPRYEFRLTGDLERLGDLRLRGGVLESDFDR